MRSAERYGVGMSDDTGGKAMSAVPFGTLGTSTVAGAEAVGPGGPWVVCTSAGLWITPIVGGVLEFERSSLARAKPQATSAAATTIPTVEPIRTRRDRRFDSIASATTPTLSTRTGQ